MKKVLLPLSLIAFIFVSSLSVSGQKTDLSGIWNLDRQKSVLPEYMPVLVKITVILKGDSLLTQRVYAGGDGEEFPFTENLTLDGTENKITIFDMPRKTKAIWSEQNNTMNLESTTTFNGSNGAEDFISNETWKVDKTANTLTINFKNKTSGGESEGYFIFTGAEKAK